ncbi:MAG: hypothetical protein JWL75_106 [Parcubacteria group bacterium]|nr:hypothetical protein [Parcubacteria group bacterium]
MSNEWPKGTTEPVIQEKSKSELGKTFQPDGPERPAITDIEREQTEARLTALGKLMNDSHLWWQLDGSLPLSLRQKEVGGDYIGAHSDIDISVLRDELPALETYLKEQGYALFLQSKNGEARTFRRIGNATFSRRTLNDVREIPYIAAIDEQGNIRTDTDLVRMQVSVIDTDTDGNPTERGLSYPKEWLEGSSTSIDDTPLTLSHPARHLLFKLWYMRDYDDKDVELWSEMHALSSEDLDTLEHIIMATASNPEWWEQNKNFKKDTETLQRRFTTLRNGIEKDL